MPLRHSEIEGLALVHEDPAHHEYPVHTHDGYSVIGLTSGSKWFDIRGDRVQVKSPGIAIANPHDPHGCEPVDGPWAHRTWYVSAPLMAEIAGVGPDRCVRFSKPAVNDPALAVRLRRVHEAYGADAPLEWQSDVLSALQSLVRNHASGVASEQQTTDHTSSGRRVAAYEDAIRDSISGASVDLGTLAALGGVQVNQVIRDFRQIHGMTPGEFLRMKRLQHAKKVLNDGASLTEAAMEAGFSDQSHFSRMFRRAYGMTPSDYRRLGVNGSQHNPL